MADDELPRLLYCLESGFPAPVTAALLLLARGTTTIHNAETVWHTTPHFDPDIEFVDAVKEVTGDQAATCVDCGTVDWIDEFSTAHNGDLIGYCCIHAYSSCHYCDQLCPDDDMTWVDDDAHYCSRCLDRSCHYCDYCEVWYRYDDHNHGCDCEAPNQRFTFPANGAGSIGNDDRLQVVLPAGTISDEGLRQVQSLLYHMVLAAGDGRGGAGWVSRAAMEAVGDQWLGAKGNFTRRLSSHLYKNHKIKIPKDVLTEIGNVARQNSSDDASWDIEFTRDLNQSADAFAHNESCWWQSYYHSRCCLKSWGGIGMRAFGEPTPGYPEGRPVGRAWIHPVDEDFLPTHNTMTPHAYVVFNQYGTLDGAKAARIVAHLTGGTYRKVPFDYRVDDTYVNNGSGWLVGPEDVIAPVEGIFFTLDPHDHRDAEHHHITIDQEVAA